nr:hypothetical protein [Thermoguttaceae bacterium]
MDIVAIDFEFTNQSEKTICAVGIVRPGKPVLYTLVQPPADTYWDPICSSIHGIGPKDVTNSPKLPEIWDSILDYIGDGVLVAHCAKEVERHVILKNAEANSLSYPRFKMLCSRILAKRTFPDLKSYGLESIAHSLGLKFNHHHAGEDASVSLLIAQLALEHLGEEYCSNLVFYIDEISRAKKKIHSAQEQQNFMASIPQGDGRFEGLDFAFTGKLPREHSEMARIVRNFGGTASDDGKLTKITDYLVMGDNEYSAYANGDLSTNKIKKVQKMIEKGK